MAQSLPQPVTPNITLASLAAGSSTGDVPIYSSGTWAAGNPVPISLAVPTIAVSGGITDSRAYQAITKNHRTEVQFIGAVSIEYNNDIAAQTVTITLPIATSNWIVGRNQVHGVVTHDSATFVGAKVTQSVTANQIVITVDDPTNVGAKILVLNYCVDYLITVASGLPAVLT